MVYARRGWAQFSADLPRTIAHQAGGTIDTAQGGSGFLISHKAGELPDRAQINRIVRALLKPNSRKALVPVAIDKLAPR
jgi:hypothetical protein